MGATLGTEGGMTEVTPETFDQLFGPTRDGEEIHIGMKTGDRVIMHGLRTRTELNGRFAVLLNPVPRNGRFHLRLEDDGRHIRAQQGTFTKILAQPAETVDVETSAENVAIDTTTLLHGNCCICLTEKACKAAIPCGHLILCESCAVRHKGSCPICRHTVFSWLHVYTPGGSREEELEKALAAASAAKKRVVSLEARFEKRRRTHGEQQGCAPEVGSWVRMPTRKQDTAPTAETEFSQQLGEIITINKAAGTCTVRFRLADQDAYVEEGAKHPSDRHTDVEMPLEVPFQAVYTHQEMKWCLPAQDLYCVPLFMKGARQKKLRAERRAKSSRAAPQK